MRSVDSVAAPKPSNASSAGIRSLTLAFSIAGWRRDNQGLGTIVNDDQPQLAWSLSANAVGEGLTISATLTRNTATDQALRTRLLARS